MNRFHVAVRSLKYFWLTDLAVILGVAVGVSVLGGALLVGHSMRESLAAMVERRLGHVESVLVAPNPFNDSLGERVMLDVGTVSETNKRIIANSVLMTKGSICDVEGKTIAGDVTVFGWGKENRSAFEIGKTCGVMMSGKLRQEIGESFGGNLRLRLNKVVGSSNEGLFGIQKDRVGILPMLLPASAEGMPEDLFSLSLSQREPRNVWVPLEDMQKALGMPGKANVLLVHVVPAYAERGSPSRNRLKRALESGDYQIRLVELPDGVISIESEQLLIPKALEEALSGLKGDACKVFAYLATTVRNDGNGKEFPYSTLAGITSLLDGDIPEDGIVLNRWAADDLGASPGDTIVIEYPVRGATGIMETGSARLVLDRIIEMDGFGVDKSLVPEFKGLTDVDSMAKWNPPRDFRFDSSRVRDKDEDYWNKYRAAPKGFINIATAKRLWGTEFGGLTSIRVRWYSSREFEKELLSMISPESMGLVFRPIREEQLKAAKGGTDFGGLFLGFSFFLILSSALLTALLQRLSVEQRVRHVGVMAAMGFTKRGILRIFLGEGILIVTLGCCFGAVGSVVAAHLMIWGLKTVWVRAVGTNLLDVYLSCRQIGVGCLGGWIVGTVSIWRGISMIGKMPVIQSIHGVLKPTESERASGTKGTVIALSAALGALILIVGSTFSDAIPKAGAFFGAGVLLLVSGLAIVRVVLAKSMRFKAVGGKRTTLLGLSVRNAAGNPTRSILTVGLAASAVFIITSVGAMHSRGAGVDGDKKSGMGGYSLIVDADVPLPYDLASPEGRKYLAVPDVGGLWDRVSVVGMRANVGDDLSCRNLYRPGEPRVAGIPKSMIDDDAFSFVSSMSRSKNRWKALDEVQSDGAVPVIADYETAQWILHKKLGDTIPITDERGGKRNLRIVGLLRKSIFQSELLMSMNSFKELFPSGAGFSRFLIRCDKADVGPVSDTLKQSLGDFGMNIETTAERLDSYFEIANTYIAAFEALGGLGMLLGGLGLTIVLARGIIERRNELMLMSAVGLKRWTIIRLNVIENVLLLVIGILLGTVAADTAVFGEVLKNYGDLGWRAILGRMLPGWITAATVLPAVLSMIVVAWVMIRKTTAGFVRVE